MVQHLNVDVYVAVNLLMNGFLLWMTGRLVRVRLTPLRLLLAAGSGALYSLAFLLPSAGFLFSPAAKFVFSLVMVAIAFQPSSWWRLLGISALFYAIAFLSAGSIIAMVFLRGPEIVFPVRWWFLPASILVVLVAGAVSYWYLHNLVKLQAHFAEAEILLGESRGRLRGYMDTGNCLRDPFTGAPVLVAEWKALRRILPGEMSVTLDRGPIEAMQEMSCSRLADRVRLIPYRALGNSGGFMWGFRPDAVIIHVQGQSLVVREVVVAVALEDLMGGGCDCLIPPDLVSGAVSGENPFRKHDTDSLPG